MLNGECLGVQLEEGVRFGVPPSRVASLFWMVKRAVEDPRLSCRDLEVILGSLQWYHLLRRPLLAGLHQVYRHIHGQPVVACPELPEGVVEELACAVLFSAFWTVDLCKPYAPLLGASDASTAFGFGACVSPFPPELVPRLARWCEKAGAFAVVSGVEDPASARRAGGKLELEITLADFRDVLCVRAAHHKHINVLESEGLLMWLKWYARSCHHQDSRVVVLIDSTVVAQAAATGRSSSGIGHVLRRLAALELATGVVLFPLIVPSAHNPADASSRGTRRRRASNLQPPPPSRDDRWWERSIARILITSPPSSESESDAGDGDYC